MNVPEHTLGDANNQGGGERPPCTGLTPDALPEATMPVKAKSSQTGVSTNYSLNRTTHKTTKSIQKSHWYALRATYGREKKAYKYFIHKKIEAFYPTIITTKVIDGKRKSVEESRIPNIFFARGTEEEIKSFVYDNVNLPYLRFYYRYFHDGAQIIKEPLIIPDYQMESLKIICTSESGDIVLAPTDVLKFKIGQKVRIINGSFRGVVGKVARYQGQQRVAVIIDGLLTIATAYIPSDFLEYLQ